MPIDSLEPTVDPQALRVNEHDVDKSVFIIPTDVPIPGELSGATMSKGSLYERLAPLDKEPESFVFVPLSGAELTALDRVWHTLVKPKRVYALLGLPGGRYDVLFTQSTRQIGIQTLDWLSVAQSLTERARHVQRTMDTRSWDVKQDLTTDRRPLRDTSTDVDSRPLPLPAPDHEDQT